MLKLDFGAAIVFCLGTLLGFCGGCTDVQDDAMHIGESLGVVPAELKQLKENAIAGDLESAVTLRKYYGVSDYQPHEEVFWTDRAARLGDPGSQYCYAVMAFKQGRVDDKQRAFRYLVELDKNGDTRATSLMLQIQEKTQVQEKSTDGR